MSPRQTLLALSAALVVAGLVLGLGGLSADGEKCGSVLSPQNGGVQIADAISGDDSHQQACDDAIGNAKPLAYGALGLGALALIVSFVAPTNSGPQAPASTPGTPQP